jgi:uncharacterized protein YkwD
MKQLRLGVSLFVALAAFGITSPAAQAERAEVRQANLTQNAASGASAAAQINTIRARAGLPPVQRNAKLDAAAHAQASFMAANRIMTHKGRNGSDVGQRVSSTGYTWCTVAENVSRGYRTEARAIEAWRVSPGHYRNLVNHRVTQFGIANVGGFRAMVLAARRC